MQAALTEIAGVTSADVTLPDRAVVKIEPGKEITTKALTAAVAGAGFSATAAN